MMKSTSNKKTNREWSFGKRQEKMRGNVFADSSARKWRRIDFLLLPHFVGQMKVLVATAE